MTADPTYTALRAYHRCVADLMGDPDVTGDLLLIGMWLARAVHLRLPEPGPTGWAGELVIADLFGNGRHDSYRYREALRTDLPRYSPTVDNPASQGTCTAPMIRRDGPCGKRANTWGWLTDTATGRMVPSGACRDKRHQEWARTVWRANRAEVAALGEHLPKPAANCGGALARHIRRVRWERLWLALDPTWTPPAEGAPTRKPRLEVLTFEPCDDEPEVAVTKRPTFGLIQGGWN